MKPVSIQREELRRLVSRRWFLRDAGVGIGSFALLSLLGGRSQAAAQNPLAPRNPHFTPKAKRVIYIFQAGAPSHLDLFDNKPELSKRTGKLPPPELLKDYRAAFINPNSALLGAKFKFKRTASQARNFRSCCRSLRRLRMIFASSARCTRTRSITLPRKSW